MSFGFNALKTTPKDFNDSNAASTTYGIESPMVAGLGAARKRLGFSHQLESSELNYQKNKDRMNMIMLRNTQGLHAPMRLAMEIKSAERIGRLPFLPSSNLMRDVILGRDEDICFEDILNTAEFREQMGQPHAVVEKSLGIL
ncbi:proteasome maturation protein [Phymastichus coffea]|uniref:proteasome maturation protein n=1 Tax=Phymastichus coffea TaxID=108790 RepID=UPI00273C8DA2|nr:proteasome maturation protein [Phymastichus coffea]XP_058788587.1 proteasome maturation protein [Phymastichus coffea]